MFNTDAHAIRSQKYRLRMHKSACNKSLILKFMARYELLLNSVSIVSVERV